MTDKELADRVVELEVGSKHFGLYSPIHINSTIGTMVEPSLFVRDWRVVGTLMEKLDAHFIEKLTEAVWAVRSDKPYGEGKTREWYENESLPRAIIEACVEALEADK